MLRGWDGGRALRWGLFLVVLSGTFSLRAWVQTPGVVKATGSGTLVIVGRDRSADGLFAALVVPPTGTTRITWSADGFATVRDVTPASGLLADGATSFAFAGDLTPIDPASPTTYTIAARFEGGPAGGIAITMLQYNPTFAATFSDLTADATTPEAVAIHALTRRGIVGGYGDGSGRFGPGDPLLRAQAAAIVVRSLGWEAEMGQHTFPDQGAIDDELWNAVRVLADHDVAHGYPDGTYQPTGVIAEVQVIALITRALVARGYWRSQPDDGTLYPDTPAASGHRGDLATYVHYLGAVPGSSGTGMGDWPTWDRPASRGWMARAIWGAVQWREGLLTATALPVAATDPTLIGAGDIGGCNTSGDEATARLLDLLPGTVFTLGDDAYDSGSPAEYATCYEPTWGRHRARTRPAPGNHEYVTPGAAGYFGYFGGAAGTPGQGYYSYDLGAWHIVVLNSNCASVGGCGAGSPQEQWLRADLTAHATACTLAYWHHPRFSSGQHGSNADYQPFWQALYAAGADLILVGHDHDYERFAPQDPAGQADSAHGIRQFVVGTGGRSHYAVTTSISNSQVRNGDTFGVLRLNLHPTSYDWQFIPEAGKGFSDVGSGVCH